MNMFQAGIQNLMSWAYSGKMLDAYEAAIVARQRESTELMAYYEGKQRRPLRPSATGKDYNILANMTGVIVNRSVSMLVGAGVDFNVPEAAEDADPAEANTPHEYIEDVWEANRGDILLHDLVQFGSIYGTPYLKIVPDSREYKGKLWPRLVALNPYHMAVFTAPDDIENVTAYVNRWNSGDTAWREVTEKRENVWYIRMEKNDSESKGLWVMAGDEIIWPWTFPPISHTKNLPCAGHVYGMSDIEAVIDLQDKYNASQSDINVILGNNAFPLRYTSGGKLPRVTLKDGSQVVDISPSKIIEFTDKDAKMNTVEMQSDLSSSRSFASDIRRDIFDIAQTVDAETLRQNASSITNFGLRVMYKDELAKNATKQMLYGALLCEVNQHLLTMAGWSGDNTDPGDVVWGDPLPTNPIEEITALEKDKELGIVSNKTISQIRDYDYEQEQAQIAEEKKTAGALGGSLLRDFMAGRNIEGGG
jgi:hypothetical protein